MLDVFYKTKFQLTLAALMFSATLASAAQPAVPTQVQTGEVIAVKQIIEPASGQYNYKSYREWKNSKISDIESRVKILREKFVQGSMTRSPSKDSNLTNSTKTEAGINAELQDQLDQELLNLSISRDLSISDYFVGYLIKQPSLDRAIHEVSARLTAEEVAELMDAFAQHFFQSKSNGVKSAPRADFSTK